MKFFHRFPGTFQVIAADFAFIVPQFCQLGLQGFDVLAAGSVPKRPVKRGKENRQGSQVGDTGGFQIIILLKFPDGLPCCVSELSGQFAGIIAEIFEPGLKGQHVFALVFILQDPPLEDLLTVVKFFLFHHIDDINGFRFGVVSVFILHRHGFGFIGFFRYGSSRRRICVFSLCNCADRKNQTQDQKET